MAKNLDSRKLAREKGNEDEVLPVIEDAERYAALDGVANSEGGKILIEGLSSDCVDAIEVIRGSYKTATHAELLALCATLDARLAVLQSLQRAATNKTLARERIAELLA